MTAHRGPSACARPSPIPNLFITPGQFGRVRVPMSQLHPTILVPDAAVVTDQSVKMLFTVSPDGTVVPKPVELGPVTDDNLRVVRSGITADDQIIINGLLRARPGAKVTPEMGTIGAPPAPPGAADSHEYLAFLYRPADLRGSHLHSDHADRRHRLFQPAGGAISRHRAALDLGDRVVSGRLRRNRRQDRCHADRARGQRRGQHALHDLAIDQRRRDVAGRHLRARHQSRYRAGAGAEPGRHRPAASARGSAQYRRDGREAIARPDDGDPSELARRLARPALHLQLCHPAREGRARPHRRRRQCHHLRRARLLDAHLARSGKARRPRPDRRRRGHRAARAERAGGRRRDQPAAGASAGRLPAQCRDARAPHRPRRLRQYHREVRTGWARGPRQRHRPRGARGRGLQPQRLSRQASGHTHGHLPAARVQRPANGGGGASGHGRPVEVLPQGRPVRHRLQPDFVYLAIGRGGDRDHFRGRHPRGGGDHPVPPDLARLGGADRRHPGVADRHVRRAGGARLLAQQSLAVRPGARHRHRGRRRHRGGGECRAQHPRRFEPEGRRLPDHGGGRRRADRHRARAVRGVHPVGVPERYSRPVLPPVRRHHRHRDGDLADRLADAQSGPLRAAVQAARSGASLQQFHRARDQRILPRLQPRLRMGVVALRRD